jgi:uncharacterized protein (DUF2267 family)
MNRKELLTLVKEEAELENLRQADHAVRVIVGALKAMLPDELAEKVKNALPEDLQVGWETVGRLPADILEREDFYFEGIGSEEGKPSATITDG